MLSCLLSGENVTLFASWSCDPTSPIAAFREVELILWWRFQGQNWKRKCKTKAMKEEKIKLIALQLHEIYPQNLPQLLMSHFSYRKDVVLCGVCSGSMDTVSSYTTFSLWDHAPWDWQWMNKEGSNENNRCDLNCRPICTSSLCVQIP